MPCPDGQCRRWMTEDPAHLNERRAAAGLPPVEDDPPEAEPTAETREGYQNWLRGYEEWLCKAGWR